MNRFLLLITLPVLFIQSLNAQPCTPLGDEVSYGTNDVWIGYVYSNMNFTSYAGYVTEGTAGNPAFDQSFGGDNVNYATNGCQVETNTFSVRYKLQEIFIAGGYQFTVGGDDGFRLSLDGGATWVINRWQDQAYNQTTYTAWLDGSYDMVLEYYENGGGNRISFTYTTACVGSEDTDEYGTNDTWRGYVYDGINFNAYMGMVEEGSPGIISFDENFGGNNVLFNTTHCSVQTETFSVRYRLRKNFPTGNYVFQVGGDDGYRLSLDGGSSWVIDRWWDQSYNSSSYSANLTGVHDLVLEYFENGGDNRISITVQSNIILKVDLLLFEAQKVQNTVQLNWDISEDSDPDQFIIQRSSDGRQFEPIQTISGFSGQRVSNRIKFMGTDNNPPADRLYYRLAMRDRDQSITYSPTVTINDSKNQKKSWEVFPTIAENGQIFVRATENRSGTAWKLYNMQGQVLQHGHAGITRTGQVVSIQLQNLSGAPGWYLLTLSDGQGLQQTNRIWIP